MNAYDTIDALSRLARSPTIDDAQLDTLVTALGSTDGYVDQIDGGYGSTYSEQVEVTVRGCAEGALKEAVPRVLPRLVGRLATTTGDVRAALVRLVGGAGREVWVGLSPQERGAALTALDVLAGDSRFSTLGLDEPPGELLAARSRDVVALQVLAIDATTPGELESVTSAIRSALSSPAFSVRRAAQTAVGLLRDPRGLVPFLIDALLAPSADPHGAARAISASKARLDVAARRRLVAFVDHPRLGDAVCTLLVPWVRDATAEAELPIAARVLAAVARLCAASTNEGAWYQWLKACGAELLAPALVTAVRERLTTTERGSDELLQHAALVGPGLAPIAPDLLRFLDPATAPSPRHVYVATKLAAAIGSPVTAPALVSLLSTTHRYEALLALAAIGPGPGGEVARLALPSVEALPAVRDSDSRERQRAAEQELVFAAQQKALQALRRA